MSWETIALGEVAEVFNGKTPSKADQREVGHAVLKVRDLDSRGHFRGDFNSFVAPDYALRFQTRWAEPGDTVILNAAHSSTHVASKTAHLGEDVRGALITGEWLAIRTSAAADSRFIYYWLTSKRARAHLRELVKGIHLYPRDVANLKVSVPPVEEQRRIAAILGQADETRAKRRAQLAHLDELPQALFHEMFGEESAYAESPLGDVAARIDNGTSVPCESRPAETDERGILKLGAVTYGTFRPHENKAFLGDASQMLDNEVRPGDVLMTRKNTRELVGAVAVVGTDVPPGLLLPDLIFRLHLDPARIARTYFQTIMMGPSMRAKVRGLASGSAASMPNISKARLRSLPIPIPPLAEQQAFAEKVEAIQSERSHITRALEADDELFAALQHRAFRGEL